MPTAKSTRTTTKTPDAKASIAGKKAAATRKRNTARHAAQTAQGELKATVNSPQAKAARTNAENAADAAAAATAAEARVRAAQVRVIAERTVDVPVGASLMARDTVVSTVRGIADTIASRAKMERNLNTFERRGASARGRLESQVRRRRDSVERDLSHRSGALTSRVEKLVSGAQNRIGL